MIIRKGTLAWKMYREWELRGGSAPATLNLCHFVRVLALWLPLRALVCARRDWTKFRHLQLAAFILAPVALLAWVFARFIDWFERKQPEWFATVPWNDVEDVLRLYRDYRAAKTGRFCPRVEIEQ